MSGLTIVLPTYDRRHVLERTIGCYQELAKQWPLLVVDDGSHDGTAEWLAGLGLRVLRLPHGGLPAARNAGLRAATTPWVLFGEDDVLMRPEMPQRLLDWATRLPHCGAVAPRLHDGTAWDLPAMAPTPAAASPLLPGRFGARVDAAHERPQALPLVHACALVDRRAVLATGGYDPAYDGSHYREESEVYARLWRLGRSVWLAPDAWAIHVRHRLGGGCRGRGGAIARLANRWSYWRNDARYIDRHARMWRVWAGTPSPGVAKAASAAMLIANLCRQTLGAMRHTRA